MINSIFDDDLYKFTMQQAILKLYPDAVAKYRFTNRGNQCFNDNFISLLKKQINNLEELRALDKELNQFSKLPFVHPWYIEFLKNYRYNASQIELFLDNNKNLQLEIKGPWYSTILWEVKLMALISQCFFELEDSWSMDGQQEKIKTKIHKLASAQCKYADFGTRRRRNYDIQDLVVSNVMNYHHFVGTSNVHLAFKYNLRPIGTMAHEWVQGISALESLNHANRVMLKRWADIYDSDLGIALTDTFGTDAFFNDFGLRFSKLFDGVRHDSGDPFVFTDKVIKHYQKFRINPQHKTIVFSDGLDADKAINIKQYCDSVGIDCSFGIGTNFTNDFQTPALNMVIKLWSINDVPVVKLSDVPTKANGDSEAVKVVKWLYRV